MTGGWSLYGKASCLSRLTSCSSIFYNLYGDFSKCGIRLRMRGYSYRFYFCGYSFFVPHSLVGRVNWTPHGQSDRKYVPHTFRMLSRITAETDYREKAGGGRLNLLTRPVRRERLLEGGCRTPDRRLAFLNREQLRLQ